MRLGAAAYGMHLLVQPVMAFPASDASSPSTVVPSASAATADASDASALAHQLQLLNGYSSVVGPGWNFGASLGLQEVFNDNVFQSSSDRRWDLISVLTPSVYAYGDTQRIQLRLNYQPSVNYYARNSSLNQITPSLNATSDVIVWQDHLYLDLRATSGISSASGSTPGLGYGQTGAGTQVNSLNGLNKQNSTQYNSYEASPYFLQSFDTYGTLKVGYTYAMSTTSNSAGFVLLPVTTTGTAASQTSNQELIQFTTGSFLERMSDTVLLNGTQSQNTTTRPHPVAKRRSTQNSVATPPFLPTSSTTC